MYPLRFHVHIVFPEACLSAARQHVSSAHSLSDDSDLERATLLHDWLLKCDHRIRMIEQVVCSERRNLNLIELNLK